MGNFFFPIFLFILKTFSSKLFSLFFLFSIQNIYLGCKIFTHFLVLDAKVFSPIFFQLFLKPFFLNVFSLFFPFSLQNIFLKISLWYFYHKTTTKMLKKERKQTLGKSCISMPVLFRCCWFTSPSVNWDWQNKHRQVRIVSYASLLTAGHLSEISKAFMLSKPDSCFSGNRECLAERMMKNLSSKS